MFKKNSQWTPVCLVFRVMLWWIAAVIGGASSPLVVVLTVRPVSVLQHLIDTYLMLILDLTAGRNYSYKNALGRPLLLHETMTNSGRKMGSTRIFLFGRKALVSGSGEHVTERSRILQV
jgi:hypothetical protein